MSLTPLPPITIALDPGPAAWLLRQQLRRVAKLVGSKPLVPVVPIAGPFEFEDGIGLAAVRNAVETVRIDLPYLPCDLDGLIARLSGTGGTIGADVRPSAELGAVAIELDEALAGLGGLLGVSVERFLVPAVRIGGWAPFVAAGEALGLLRPPWHRRLLGRFLHPAPPVRLPRIHRPLDATRLLVLVGDRPHAGLDLAPRRWLRTVELTDRSIRAEALRSYRQARGYELREPVISAPGETWLLADLHLGHPDISLYCGRPFLGGETAEHDRVLVQNWQQTVRSDGHAVLLGDVCASSDPDAYRAAITSLSGRLELVRGNHDPDLPGLVSHLRFDCDGQRFLAVHDPADAPIDFDGWVVHGHHHDADLERFPFFDPGNRRVNVSVETAGYAPVPLSLVCHLIREGAGRITRREIQPM